MLFNSPPTIIQYLFIATGILGSVSTSMFTVPERLSWMDWVGPQGLHQSGHFGIIQQTTSIVRNTKSTKYYPSSLKVSGSLSSF